VAKLPQFAGTTAGGAGTNCRQMIFVERYGSIIGIALLLSVSICAFLLARKAARNVKRFREDHHESFLGGKKQ
jgi:hypothetical protein